MSTNRSSSHSLSVIPTPLNHVFRSPSIFHKPGFFLLGAQPLLPRGTLFFGFSPSHPPCSTASSSQIGSEKMGQIKASAFSSLSLKKCLTLSCTAVCQQLTKHNIRRDEVCASLGRPTSSIHTGHQELVILDTYPVFQESPNTCILMCVLPVAKSMWVVSFESGVGLMM